jgi:hypothetical protein
MLLVWLLLNILYFSILLHSFNTEYLFFCPCYIDGQKNKYSVLNEYNRMLKYKKVGISEQPIKKNSKMFRAAESENRAGIKRKVRSILMVFFYLQWITDLFLQNNESCNVRVPVSFGSAFVEKDHVPNKWIKCYNTASSRHFMWSIYNFS